MTGGAGISSLVQLARRGCRVSLATMALGLTAFAASVAPAQSPARPRAADKLGTVDFPVSCTPASQAAFNHAVALLHHMTYPEARTAFGAVATNDPTCAMAQWGVAMTLFQPLWPTRPSPAVLQQGWAAVQKAQSLHPPTERERLFVATTEAFFLGPESPDYWQRIRRWGAATARVHERFPEDPEASAFYALSLLATASLDSSGPRHAEQAAALLLAVYAKHPDHPGAMHYLVHTNDATGRERNSLEITRKYDASAPGNPHALHMPTHIYTRLGDWSAVIQGNLRAANAALAHPAGDHGQYVWDEFPHAIEYLVYAELQQGRDDEAAAQLDRLHATERLEPTFKTAFHLASTEARYALERRDWQAAAALVPRDRKFIDWDRFAWPEAITVFAHGMGAVHTGSSADAAAMRARLGTLEEVMRSQGEMLFSSNIRLLRRALSAWIAQGEGNAAESVALMQEAVALEAATPKHAVTPAPTLPALELLGDLQMEQRHPADALQSYRSAIALYPNRFNGLLGAARAARALGDKATARGYYQQLLEVAVAGTRALPLDEARRFVADSR